MKQIILGMMVAVLVAAGASAKEVRVDGRKDRIDLDSSEFTTHHTFKGSRLVKELHFDSSRGYLVYRLRGTYYQRCDVDQAVVDNWIAAESVNNYYADNIKDAFECCDDTLPDCEYESE
jgi:hypothetical protein